MPYPIPIIVGTAIATVGSVYCFKKFVYDPHLAPIIEAIIAQHRPVHGHTAIYAPPVASQSSSGRSSALETGTDKLRRRTGAEMYELDETRILNEERDLPPPPYAVRKRRSAPVNPKPAVQVSQRKGLLNSSREKAVQDAPSEKLEEEQALIGLDAPAQSPVAKDKLVEECAKQGKIAEIEPITPTFHSAHDLGSSSELHMPVPQTARFGMPQILQYEAPLSPSTVSSVLSSPQLVGASEMGDDDVISLSGVSNNTASYVDAETYTPRTLSPFDFSVVSSRAISPQEQRAFADLGLAQVLSQSSAGWDEVRGSDSEWEVLSDRR